jgi:hypothetical protein
MTDIRDRVAFPTLSFFSESGGTAASTSASMRFLASLFFRLVDDGAVDPDA